MPPKGGKPKRSLPYRDASGRYRKPDGRFTSAANAKRAWRLAERQELVKILSETSGESEATVRERIKGIPTSDIIGEHRGYSRSLGITFRGDPSPEGQAVLDDFGILDNSLTIATMKAMDKRSP